MKEFAGVNTLEVWDFRLSVGSPVLYANGEFWKVCVYANNPGDKDRVVLAEHTTDVKTNGDVHDVKGIRACYAWLHTIRDKFARDHIELRKPIAKAINGANAKANAINAEALQAERDEDIDLANQKRGELQAHLSTANAAIKVLTAAFHKQVAELVGGAE